ncbi:MAG: recombinase family protein [Oscillospiraceae bacterium]|nr:recombinase family protein [Oscillospiraceae bacterium]
MAERVDCLYRVSTTKQVDHDELNQADIPVQRKACRDFAEKMGWIIVNEEQETGVSGYKVSANDRDKLQLIKKRAEQGKFDILLVFMFDRLGRKSDETPFVVEWFVKHGVRVWSVNEGEQRFESHTDRLTNYIRYWQADGESQKTSIRTKTAMGQMVQEGRFRGGGVPYGYRLAPSGILNKRKHEVWKLEIDEDEARVVRMMFNLCVGFGYGRCKIANMISGQGIKTRTGSNWHEATVGHILHNVAYTGVLRSGESQSEIFEELQIVDPDTFALAQKLMAERVNEYNEQRTMPKNISGQAMLSGNIFCGHCGGRLILTTNGTVRHNLKGGTVFRRRVRYVCYNKTRHRVDCDGQTGYTTHILDGLVTRVLHQIFDKMKSIREDEIVSRTQMNVEASVKEQLAAARREFAKATKEYEAVKAKLYDVIRGKSSLPESVLTEMADEAKEKMLAASEKVSELSSEAEKNSSRAEEIRKDYQRILKWSELFDDSDIATKKMVAGYLIKRIDVYTDYRLHIEFNINFAQFELGLEMPNEYKGQKPA